MGPLFLLLLLSNPLDKLQPEELFELETHHVISLPCLSSIAPHMLKVKSKFQSTKSCMICPAQLSDLHCHHLPFVHHNSAMLSVRVFPEAVLEARVWFKKIIWKKVPGSMVRERESINE